MGGSFDLDPVARITAGAVGEPGARTFYFQAQSALFSVTLLLEKEQVRILGEALERLLASIPEGPEGPVPGDADLEFQDPLVPGWRAGSMAIEYDHERDCIAIVLNELPANDDDDDEDGDAEDLGMGRFVVTRAQARALAEHVAVVVAAGRPRCQLCGSVIEPDGTHVCASMNGHRSHSE